MSFPLHCIRTCVYHLHTCKLWVICTVASHYMAVLTLNQNLCIVQLNLNLTLACKSLEKFCKILTSTIQTRYAHIMLRAVWYASNTTRVVCSLMPCHPLSLVHAQYIRYKCPNCSNHGQRMYLIQPHSTVSSLITGAHY